MDIHVLLFDQVDLLDSGGPYEVFLTASRLAERDGRPRPFEVKTVSVDGEPVSAYGGLGLSPGGDLASVRTPGVLVVPGAIDIESALADRALVDAVARTADRLLIDRESLVTSVCTGAFLLGAAGLLADRDWTTHWADVELLAARVGSSGATRGVRWVDTGQIVTSGGLSAGLDMALHLVDRLEGRELATRTARQIDYRWRADGSSEG